MDRASKSLALRKLKREYGAGRLGERAPAGLTITIGPAVTEEDGEVLDLGAGEVMDLGDDDDERDEDDDMSMLRRMRRRDE